MCTTELNWVTKRLMRRGGGLRQSQGLRLDCGRQDGALFSSLVSL